ncbi:MAG: hypothetical protein RMY62_003460 [Nostoc sp. ZfuVER08]|jgi:hypothetical protein|nr:hypothetical protein [Nostoc punctiforme]MDZ8010344.1 hypothetical protein [Nostoc sp. ZfuVER08]
MAQEEDPCKGAVNVVPSGNTTATVRAQSLVLFLYEIDYLNTKVA